MEIREDRYAEWQDFPFISEPLQVRRPGTDNKARRDRLQCQGHFFREAPRLHITFYKKVIDHVTEISNFSFLLVEGRAKLIKLTDLSDFLSSTTVRTQKQQTHVQECTHTHVHAHAPTLKSRLNSLLVSSTPAELRGHSASSSPDSTS